MSNPADDSAYVMEIAPVATPTNLVTVLNDNKRTEQAIRDIIIANGAEVLYFGWSFQRADLGGLAQIHAVVLFGGVEDELPIHREGPPKSTVSQSMSRLDEVAATIRLAIDEGGTMVVCAIQRLDPSSWFGPYEPADVS